MGKIDEIKLSIESEDFAQRRTGRKGTSYYNGLAAGYREGYLKRASEGKESPDENGNCIKPDVSISVCDEFENDFCLKCYPPFPECDECPHQPKEAN